MGINGHRNHPVYMEQDNQMISQMKNMAINGQSFNYPPQQQISPSQHSIPKKAECKCYFFIKLLDYLHFKYLISYIFFMHHLFSLIK